MPRYSYTAKSFKGEKRSGFLEAQDEHHLAKLIRQEKSFLVSFSLEKNNGTKKKKAFLQILTAGKKVPLKEKIMFIRNLEVMVGAGISLPKALQTLADQSKNKVLKKTLLDVTREIIKGENFSEALLKHPKIFSRFFVSMVKIGEETGTLEKVLETLSQKMEKEHKLRASVKGALMYPAVIMAAMLGIGTLMLIMVVPQLASTFEDIGIELPMTTKMIIGFGNFVSEKWYLGILIIFAAVGALKIVSKSKQGKETIDMVLLKTPIIGNLLKKTNTTIIIRSLSSLISSGISIVRSLEIISNTVGNACFKKTIVEALEEVKKGIKLSEILKPHQNLYPPLVIQMIAVGEETGETPFILGKLADFFEDEVNNITRNLSSIIEPVLMVFIGVAVGFFAISMLQPMYSMLGTL